MRTLWVEQFVPRVPVKNNTPEKTGLEKKTTVSKWAVGYTLAEVEEQIRKKHEKAMDPSKKG